MDREITGVGDFGVQGLTSKKRNIRFGFGSGRAAAKTLLITTQKLLVLCATKRPDQTYKPNWDFSRTPTT